MSELREYPLQMRQSKSVILARLSRRSLLLASDEAIQKTTHLSSNMSLLAHFDAHTVQVSLPLVMHSLLQACKICAEYQKIAQLKARNPTEDTSAISLSQHLSSKKIPQLQTRVSASHLRKCLGLRPSLKKIP